MALYTTQAFITLVEKLRYKAAEVHTARELYEVGRLPVADLQVARMAMHVAADALIAHVCKGLVLDASEKESAGVLCFADIAGPVGPWCGALHPSISVPCNLVPDHQGSHWVQIPRTLQWKEP